jgi:hypothetical protein
MYQMNGTTVPLRVFVFSPRHEVRVVLGLLERPLLRISTSKGVWSVKLTTQLHAVHRLVVYTYMKLCLQASYKPFLHHYHKDEFYKDDYKINNFAML